jgi:hypothetical protein
MKKIFFVLVSFILFFETCTPTAVKINDGIYLVNQLGYDTTVFSIPSNNEQLVSFNPDFVENTADYTKALILTSEYVPIELLEAPKVIKQTEDKKKLQLELRKEAAETLESFSANHIMREAALVINGEVLTVHKIRDTIRGGHLEITRCSDNACEKLEVHLKNNLRK